MPFCSAVFTGSQHRSNQSNFKGAYNGKVIVFGILKRIEKVYTEIVSGLPHKIFQDIIRGHLDLETVI